MIVIDETKTIKKRQLQNSPAILDEKNIVNIKPKRTKKRSLKSSFTEICPIIDVTNNDFFEMRSGEYLEIVQLDTKDIYSLNDSDLQNDIQNLSTFYSVYTNDLKIVPLNVPLNLARQKRYILKKMTENSNPSYQLYLKARIKELENLEKFRTNREYFLFIYADDERKLLERLNQLKGLLSRSNPVINLTLEKKINILFQLFNPNTKPLNENE